MFVAARMYTRLFRLRSKLDASDYLLLASALVALGLIICDTLTYQMGVMDEYETSVKLSKASRYFGHRSPYSSNPLGRSLSPRITSTTSAWVFLNSAC
jgi:hypothetical protein